MRAFYDRMIASMHPVGALRVQFATRGGKDLAYILGGIRGRHYRGLQCSYDDDFREMGLGNLMHFSQIASLVEEGAQFYDLGTEREYKERWSDSLHTTDSLLLFRR